MKIFLHSREVLIHSKQILIFILSRINYIKFTLASYKQHSCCVVLFLFPIKFLLLTNWYAKYHWYRKCSNYEKRKKILLLLTKEDKKWPVLWWHCQELTTIERSCGMVSFGFFLHLSYAIFNLCPVHSTKSWRAPQAVLWSKRKPTTAKGHTFL